MPISAAGLSGYCERVFRNRLFAGGCLAVLAAGMLYKSIHGWSYVWNNIRLAPSLALLHGYDIYPGPNDGPVLDNIYGPVRALFYLPAVLAPTPALAIFAGIWMTIAVGLTPIVLLFLDRAGNSAVAKPLSVLAICAVSFHFYWSEMMFSLWSVHADIPAVAFGAMSCLLALRYRSSPRGWLTIAAAALFASLAPWTKQTLVVFPFVPLAYLAVCCSRRAALLFGAFAISISGFLAAVFGTAFGYTGLIFNCLTVPSRHPWQISRPLSALLISTQEGLNSFLLPFAVLACLYLVSRHACQDGRQADEVFSLLDGWPLMFAVALTLFPMAVFGRIKVGGWINHFGMVSYFLGIAFGMAALSFGKRRNVPQSDRLSGYVTIFLGIYVALQAMRTLPDIARIPQTIRRETPVERAFQYSKEHPGTVYFPWYPLASLMGEQHLYHVGYGIYDRQLAGFPPPPAVINAALDGVPYMAELPRHDWLPLDRPAIFGCPTKLAALAEWDVFERCTPAE